MSVQRTAPVTDQAVQTIQTWLKQGLYPVGSTLPSQRDLAEQLNISRASLREALSRLEALGQLSIQAGKGVFITALDSKAGSAWAFSNQASLKDIYQLRYVLESFATALAAHTIQDQDLEKLQQNITDMQNCLVLQQYEQAAQLDFSFHQHIMRLADNTAILDILKKNADMLKQSQLLPFYQPNLASRTIAEHTSIYNALAQRNSAAAEQAMQQHIICAAQRAGVYFSTAKSGI
jgi:GntR family transcriptional repressor for pyruvate dehydrogenase complex